MSNQVLTVAGGSAEIEELGPGRLLIRYRGTLDGKLAEQAIAHFMQVLERDRTLVLFVDAEQVDGYSTDFRTKITNWAQESKSHGLTAIHMFFRSKLVAMGVAVFNVVTGGFIKSYSDRGKFEAAHGA